MEEVWGLAVNPKKKKEYITAADDGEIIVWDVDRIEHVKRVQLEGKLRCCAISPNGDLLVVGTAAGDVS